MPLNYTELNLAPIYTLMGVTTQFVLNDDTIIELVALDKTFGVPTIDSGNPHVDTATIRPCCIIRMADLIDLSLTPTDLMEAVLDMNGTSWIVKSYFPKPSPGGQNDGELYIILMEAP